MLNHTKCIRYLYLHQDFIPKTIVLTRLTVKKVYINTHSKSLWFHIQQMDEKRK